MKRTALRISKRQRPSLSPQLDPPPAESIRLVLGGLGGASVRASHLHELFRHRMKFSEVMAGLQHLAEAGLAVKIDGAPRPGDTRWKLVIPEPAPPPPAVPLEVADRLPRPFTLRLLRPVQPEPVPTLKRGQMSEPPPGAPWSFILVKLAVGEPYEIHLDGELCLQRPGWLNQDSVRTVLTIQAAATPEMLASLGVSTSTGGTDNPEAESYLFVPILDGEPLEIQSEGQPVALPPQKGGNDQ